MDPATARPSPEAMRDARQTLVGSLRRIGELGPAYQVLSIDSPDSATILVLESEEKLSYPIEKILNDLED